MTSQQLLSEPPQLLTTEQPAVMPDMSAEHLSEGRLRPEDIIGRIPNAVLIESLTPEMFSPLKGDLADEMASRAHLQVAKDLGFDSPPAKGTEGSVQTQYLRLTASASGEAGQKAHEARPDEQTPSPYLRPGFK